jgi:hypothetical protein
LGRPNIVGAVCLFAICKGRAICAGLSLEGSSGSLVGQRNANGKQNNYREDESSVTRDNYGYHIAVIIRQLN